MGSGISTLTLPAGNPGRSELKRMRTVCWSVSQTGDLRVTHPEIAAEQAHIDRASPSP